ncbi:MULTISPECIES: hypothetical protein [Hymenobacter]|uniref:Uncharacterized protein n=1 Tax=Hymenobacter mucosus TaxID=1411120 RepID=A0A239BFN5_9BACT|nr:MULTISPECIES: hypothetical protein [Hymenobacter]MDF7815939.1 hypothetical protein [Hymenobacter sp. YC55]SNS06855.1 hypothetical protein SAMN06269173_12323 [Hymenobacter mucosus]
MADHTFRLKNTPLGTVLVKFYQIEPYSDEAFTKAKAREFLQATVGSGNAWSLALYQGPIATNPVLPEAIAQLHARCPSCTAVRIERSSG